MGISMVAALEARSVSWGPPNKPYILHKISFKLKKGRVLMIAGPNGAGKSTLLRLLYRFYQPNTGTIHVSGEDIWKMNARAYARKTSVVLQEKMANFNLNVREIVAFGRIPFCRNFSAAGDYDEALIDSILEQLGLKAFANRDFSTLSGGERQRVMIGRALAQQPEVLILDEPTNHLDIRNKLEILNLVKGLGITVICSMHDLNLVIDYADEVLLLVNGHILAYGSAEITLTEDLVAKAFTVTTHFGANGLNNKTGAKYLSFSLP